mmetsp:Transcript_121325/g.387765  ORF Transcript_121325/g.387765 Transcript_121325/m.387765 type:complete len:354 (-) Transcript_121325:260-1321(-)
MVLVWSRGEGRHAAQYDQARAFKLEKAYQAFRREDGDPVVELPGDGAEGSATIVVDLRMMHEKPMSRDATGADAGAGVGSRQGGSSSSSSCSGSPRSSPQLVRRYSSPSPKGDSGAGSAEGGPTTDEGFDIEWGHGQEAINGSTLAPFSRGTTELLEESFLRYQEGHGPKGILIEAPDGVEYLVNFETMKQTRMQTRRVRPVYRHAVGHSWCGGAPQVSSKRRQPSPTAVLQDEDEGLSCSPALPGRPNSGSKSSLMTQASLTSTADTVSEDADAPGSQEATDGERPRLLQAQHLAQGSLLACGKAELPQQPGPSAGASSGPGAMHSSPTCCFEVFSPCILRWAAAAWNRATA